MSKKDEDGDEHEHAKVGLRELDEGTSKLSSQGWPSQVVGLELRAGPVRAPSAEPRPHAPPGLPLARPGSAERLGLAGGATHGLCCGHLGRLSGASQRLGRASFTHAATTGTSGPGVEPWCELHVRGGRGDSRSTRRTSKLAVGVLSWGEPETAAEAVSYTHLRAHET